MRMFVCIYVCTCGVCMYVWYTHELTGMYMHVCMHVYMYVCMHECMCVSLHMSRHTQDAGVRTRAMARVRARQWLR